MPRISLKLSLLTALVHFSAVTFAQAQKLPDERECLHTLYERVQNLLQKHFNERSVTVGESDFADLRNAIVTASCEASRRAIERIQNGNVPEGGTSSIDQLPSTFDIATRVTERVSVAILEEGQSSRIDALALSITFGVNALLRNDSRKFGFVEVECPGISDSESFRVSDDEATCDQGLMTLVGGPAVSLYSSGMVVCSGEASVERGKTIICRCDSSADALELMCRQ
ncbi:MAG: hypothetical protein ABJP33_01465 [Pseudoruegeria sp.]